MNYARIQNNKVAEYPLSWSDIVSQHPDTSFVYGDYTPPKGYVLVKTEPIPEHNQWLQKAVKDKVKKVGSAWVEKYLIVDKTGDELEQGKVEYSAWLKKQMIEKTQLRLDEFAQSKGYDNILSACTYATSKVEKYRAEGQRAVDLRDETWGTLENILNAIDAGILAFTTSYDDIEQELPVLSWTA